jgi:hypothetical protein
METPDEGGTQTDFYPVATDPKEDFLDSRGVVVQNAGSDDENVLISRTGDEMTFRDEVAAGGAVLTLQDLLAAGDLPIAKDFSNKIRVVVVHARHAYPLVQVVLPAQGSGWNLGGWNEGPWNNTFGGPGRFVRFPDDQYTLEHVNSDLFIVSFTEKKTGKVIYY